MATKRISNTRGKINTGKEAPLPTNKRPVLKEGVVGDPTPPMEDVLLPGCKNMPSDIINSPALIQALGNAAFYRRKNAMHRNGFENDIIALADYVADIQAAKEKPQSMQAMG